MHCPRCGQQQVSEDIKYCSRCGFQLGIVAELLAHGGFLPQLADLQKRKIFARRNGLMFSLFWFLFLLFIMTPFWAIVDVDELAAMSAILGIFGGLLLMLASFAFLKSEPKVYTLPSAPVEMPNAEVHGLYGSRAGAALPPQQSEPVSTYVPPAGSWRAPDTGEFARPGSVTENTTKLLKEDEK